MGRALYNPGITEIQMETTIVYRGYIRTMENTMETTIVCSGYIGIMENTMETTRELVSRI